MYKNFRLIDIPLCLLQINFATIYPTAQKLFFKFRRIISITRTMFKQRRSTCNLDWKDKMDELSNLFHDFSLFCTEEEPVYKTFSLFTCSCLLSFINLSLRCVVSRFSHGSGVPTEMTHLSPERECLQFQKTINVWAKRNSK